MKPILKIFLLLGLLSAIIPAALPRQPNRKSANDKQTTATLAAGAKQMPQTPPPADQGASLRPAGCDIRIIGPVVEKAKEIKCAVPPGTPATHVKLLVNASSAGVVGTITLDGSGQCAIQLDAPQLSANDKLKITVSNEGASAEVTVLSPPKGPELSRLAQVSKDDNIINGELSRMPGGRRFDLYVYSKTGALRAHSLVAVREDKSFTAGLNYKLGCEDEIRLILDSQTADKYPVKCPPPEPPRFYLVREGENSIAGPAGDVQNITAEIWQGKDSPVTGASGAKDTSGKLTVAFDRRLAAGDEIRFKAKTDKGASVEIPPIIVAPAVFDWGRIRAYFAIGVELSQNDGNRDSNDNYFSRQDLFVSFNLDKSWVNDRRFRVNTFFDTRLAAVPTSDTAGAAEKPDLNKFLSSRKAAVMQVGVYTPITVARWHWPKGQRNILFLAPLAKLGVVTPSSGDGNSNRFFTLAGYGLRSGHFREFETLDPCSATRKYDSSTAPELISYLDIVAGRFGNFNSFPIQPAQPDAGLKQLRLWRASFEGVLKVPATPLVVGFNANVKLQRSKSGYVDPPDDLRFFFGTRFDLGKVLNKVVNFSF